MSGPPLSGSSPAQAAGSSVTGSSRPQALVRDPPAVPSAELRLGDLVILSWSAPQPVAHDSAVARPTTVVSPNSSSAPEHSESTPPRHISRLTSLRVHHCVPSSVYVRPCITAPQLSTSSGSAFAIKTGSDLVIGPSRVFRLTASPDRAAQGKAKFEVTPRKDVHRSGPESLPLPVSPGNRRMDRVHTNHTPIQETRDEPKSFTEI
jgi:hypothetical protein